LPARLACSVHARKGHATGGDQVLPSQRGNGDRTQGRERPAERGGDFDDASHF
jgi:hypothetical protein